MSTDHYEVARSIGMYTLSALLWGASVTVGILAIVWFFFCLFAPPSAGGPGWGWALLIGPFGTAATIGLWMAALFVWDEA